MIDKVKEETKSSIDENESEETNNSGSESSPGGNSGNLTTPEGVIMLSAAAIFDIVSLVPGVNVISDIFGIVIIGGWLVFTRPGEALKKAIKKFLIACGIELIPIVSVAPSWTWFVYSILKDE